MSAGCMVAELGGHAGAVAAAAPQPRFLLSHLVAEETLKFRLCHVGFEEDRVFGRDLLWQGSDGKCNWLGWSRAGGAGRRGETGDRKRRSMVWNTVHLNARQLTSEPTSSSCTSSIVFPLGGE